MSGGFLGVSTFFTLSGFLIGSLLLAEQRATGRVSLGAFWERRLRRLAPAAVLGIAGIVGTAPFWLGETQQARLAWDAVAALAYLVNWRFVQAQYAYELIFVDPSPLQHFWSLAIEAQFYLLFPLVVGIVLRWTGSVRKLAAVICGLIVLSVGVSFLPSVAEAGEHRIYYGSDARAAEILVGVLVALVSDERSRGSSPGMPGWVRHAALLSLVGVVLAWVFAETSDVWLYRGGFAAYSVLSAFVVLGAMDPRSIGGPLSLGALRWAGRVSYGAYVYHWPIFLLFSSERTGLEAAPLFVCRVGLTLGLAGLSSRFVEEPIRRGRWPQGSFFPVGLVAGAATAVLALALSASLEAGEDDAAGVQVAHVARARRWMTFGDSTAAQLGGGLKRVLRRLPAERHLRVSAGLGCGVIEGGEAFARQSWKRPLPHCKGFVAAWPETAREREVEVAVVITGVWESLDWRFLPNRRRLHLGDPAFDERVSRAIGATMDGLVEAGATVFWLTSPHIARPATPKLREKRPNIWLPERQDRLNEIIRIQAERRDRVEVVDLAGFVRAWPEGEFDPGLRPDGSHYSSEGARKVAEFLVPEILKRIDDGEQNDQEPSRAR